ncbi:argininosuccinate synthase [candidate division WWE3 bacterium CG_4_8_14_3_um_filter_42_11]|uniref:Argininosuccinate synthase n=3 Tax=Katanobacteria TaxID=422282 RepID=A0A2M7TA84_UNCKA|nr:MAG: argininosuccinate synthase [candidate division WWE3 bacterium CG_4_10_14_0_2_um_filter_42_8]PJA38289.1 MAG: argininosuccinate synthase [candidate division WWE3 bacterium CG_4_9_14_3_um_filter_43_9]PJC68146.1 MAG: argininosuccinate synthase [candidate division WWE3 bacterium CG_4_8_14_3_um_filter_42_11]
MESKKEYFKIASHEGKKGEIKKVVLLYSGGLDTSCMLKWIQDEYQCELIALTLDLGQQLGDLGKAKEKALKLGAKKAYLLDCQDEFAEEYIAKGIRANATYQGDYHLSTPLGRPLLAKKAVEIAKLEGADAIAHGCTGKGNDQVRIETSVLCFNPDIKIIAPVREWAMGRDEEIEYAKKNNIPITKALDKTQECPYSEDDNMWGVTWEGGEIEDPKLEPKLDKILQVCNLPEKAPDQKEEIVLYFEKGIPTHLNGQKMKLAELIMKLNKIAGKHGVGYTILIEDRLVGLKVRGVYELPAAHVITMAHYNLEKLVSTQEENAFKEIVDSKWAHLCYSAKWMEPTMSHLNAYIEDMNQKVTGKVKLSLYKGKAEVVAVDSPNSLFDLNLATFNKNAKFNQNSSAGFIEIYGLGMKTAWSIKKAKE